MKRVSWAISPSTPLLLTNASDKLNLDPLVDQTLAVPGANVHLTLYALAVKVDGAALSSILVDLDLDLAPLFVAVEAHVYVDGRRKVEKGGHRAPVVAAGVERLSGCPPL